MTAIERPEIKTWSIILLITLGVILLFTGILQTATLSLGDIEDIETSGIVRSKTIKKETGTHRSLRKIRYYLHIDYIIKKSDSLKYMDERTYDTKTLRHAKDINLQRLGRIKRNEFSKEEQFEIDLFSDKIEVSRKEYSSHNIEDEITVWYRADNPWTASYDLNKNRLASLMLALLGLFLLTLGLFSAWKKDRLAQTNRPVRN